MTAKPPTHRSEPLQPAQARSSEVISFTEGALLRSVISSKRRPNLLVLCPNVDTASVATQIEEICGAPVQAGVVAGELRLPLHAAGTWLLRDVADLSIEQQSELHEWLSAHAGRVQVISVTSGPVHPLVEKGRFLEALFYRLNVVSVIAIADYGR